MRTKVGVMGSAAPDSARLDSGRVLVEKAEQLAQAIAKRDVVLFTDRWLSPAADVAGTVLPADVEAPSPFDSLVPAMAVLETVVAGVTDRLGEDGRRRLEAMEALRGRTTAPDA